MAPLQVPNIHSATIFSGIDCRIAPLSPNFRICFPSSPADTPKLKRAPVGAN
jgi:hypothetical protein